MREIKIECDCGQRYKFEVEPINGQMPYTIACPVCGLDGTRKANELLQRPMLISPAPAPAPEAVPVGVLATDNPPSSFATSGPPIPVAAAPVMAEAVAQPSNPPAARVSDPKPRLRINRPAESHAPPASETPAAAPPLPRPVPASRRPGAPAPAVETTGRKPSFALGLLGALLGAVIGGGIYYAFSRFTGWQIGIVGIGVGFLAGLGARVLGKEGSMELGVITATLTLCSILAGQYFYAKHLWQDWSVEYEQELGESYGEDVKEAQATMRAIPTGSDQEIRRYLAEQWSDFGERSSPASIPAEVVTSFRDEELPRIRDLASGKITKEQYVKEIMEDEEEEEAALTEEEKKEAEEAEERTFHFFFMLLLLNKVSLVSMCAGAGIAYKMSTDA